jgi:hypothetical protein
MRRMPQPALLHPLPVAPAPSRSERRGPKEPTPSGTAPGLPPADDERSAAEGAGDRWKHDPGDGCCCSRHQHRWPWQRCRWRCCCRAGCKRCFTVAFFGSDGGGGRRSHANNRRCRRCFPDRFSLPLCPFPTTPLSAVAVRPPTIAAIDTACILLCPIIIPISTTKTTASIAFIRQKLARHIPQRAGGAAAAASRSSFTLLLPLYPNVDPRSRLPSPPSPARQPPVRHRNVRGVSPVHALEKCDIQRRYAAAHGRVLGCSPTQCARSVMDNVLDPGHVATLRQAAGRGMEKLFHQGGSTSLAPAASRRRLGIRGFSVFQMAVAKTRLLIAGDAAAAAAATASEGRSGSV